MVQRKFLTTTKLFLGPLRRASGQKDPKKIDFLIDYTCSQNWSLHCGLYITGGGDSAVDLHVICGHVLNTPATCRGDFF